jgi:hypothetical protein
MRSFSCRLCQLLIILASGFLMFENVSCKVSDGGIRIQTGNDQNTIFDDLEQFFDKVF